MQPQDLGRLLADAIARQRTGDLAGAQATYRMILRTDPQQPDALHLLGLSLHQQGAHDAARGLLETSIAVRPGSALAQLHLGMVEAARGQDAAALAALERAVALAPGLADAHLLRGEALRRLGQHDAALAAFERAVELAPEQAQGWRVRAMLLAARHRAEAALASYSQALRLEPDDPATLMNRGNTLLGLQRDAAAAADFELLVAVAPAFSYAIGMRQWLRMRLCDWRGRAQDQAAIAELLAAGHPAVLPYALAALSGSEAEQQACARGFATPPTPALWRGERYGHGRIRVGYLSGDLHEHAITFLLAELFERHDQARFETIALSFGPPSDGPMRQRLRAAFSDFVDLAGLDDAAAARLIRAREIDILVDLTGLFPAARMGILAARPAPVQVNWLVFPGTLGAPYIDYLIADRHLVPPGHEAFYEERIVRLPEGYQPTDTTRPIGPAPMRAALGLPEHGFVFCCFNSAFKIAPEIFALWMQMLRAVPGSVLWLVADLVEAAGNLRAAAAQAGVDPARLVFAVRVPPPEYLARYRAADLFVDTLPYCAHSMASDALWAGLPVLTRRGTSFAGRVAASVLEAAGMADLIAETADDYVAMGVRIAREPDRLDSLRTRLAAQLQVAPLFQTDRLRQHLEAAFVTMWERAERGETAAAFTVPAL